MMLPTLWSLDGNFWILLAIVIDPLFMTFTAIIAMHNTDCFSAIENVILVYLS
ncbi:MAG TPA: hypothetical protein VK203_20735 [Nostocaceae cyanobacterium]|nr:hypothetical protein [Nostocaceae cyanobacterium]